MYRVAVIQNEVEMQHSGYVDSVPKYRERFDLGSDVAFNRFSSVNIHTLFREGEYFLLDHDCLIIGTNATSDGDVYKVLQNQDNRNLLHEYIQQGKGLLICSQKKLTPDDSLEGYSVRKTNFLPEDYEYNVISRPVNESSADGDVQLTDNEYNVTQSFIFSVPHSITNDMIRERCTVNDFQKHFYRDFIDPKKESSYFSLFVDKRTLIRNTLMVASPKKNERIVISTMALDWAGHYELLENIVRYLMVGIPEVVFITKQNTQEEVFRFLVSEAELAKIPYETYDDINCLKNSKMFRYHSLFVFSPMYCEEEVADFWKFAKNNASYIRLFHYRHIGDDEANDLVLVNFSQSRQIDMQKQAVETWLISLYNNRLWDNSFWKSYDVILAFIKLGISIEPYIVGLFNDINAHYKNGSYDGVLAPTCGLLELLQLIVSKPEYSSKLTNANKMLDETINCLVDKFKKASNYNKKFIIRAFHRAQLMEKLKKSFVDENAFFSDLHKIAVEDTVSIKDKFEVDLCLDIETCIIYNVYSHKDEQVIKKKIKNCLDVILDAQQQSGRWDNNLGKTARILLFLMEYEKEISASKMSKPIELGINALRKAYNKNNWEENIVTTANAISTLVLSDNRAKYESKDFLSQISHEVRLATSYNSLSLALVTLGRVLKRYNEAQLELKTLRKIEKQYTKCKVALYAFGNVAVVSILLLISYYIYLWLEDNVLFTKMLSESLMWIPIAVGIAITAMVGLLPNVIKKFFGKKD
jgi:hypothetical protein